MIDPTQEKNLVRMIRGKFKGEARDAIYEEEFATIAQLITFLKSIFFTSKTTYDLQGDLGHCY